MERKLTRRGLLKSMTAAIVSGASVATDAEKPMHGHTKSDMMNEMNMTKDSFPCIELNRKYSPPLPLMRKQMGRVNTPSAHWKPPTREVTG